MKLFLLLVGFAAPLAHADPFWDTFGDGKAEISSYRVTQPRYGEKRKATTVMIFVPEHVHKSTRIKVENYEATPESDRVPVLKLNRTLEFSTGIYNYNVMTSVFSSLEPQFDQLFFPMKLSISSSEWCGNFYEHLLPSKGGAKRVRHSYFEKEGDKDDFLKAPAGGVYEDNLPILIRELKGEWLKSGEKRSVKMLPSLWSSRVTHVDIGWEDATLTKEALPKENLIRWKWTVGPRTQTYWVRAEYPRYVVKWEGSDGEKGERIKSLHLPYWSHNHNKDSGLRKQLQLPE